MNTDDKPTISDPYKKFHYPGVPGHKSWPPGGKRVQLLTKGGVAVLGEYRRDGGFIGWAEVADRDKSAEQYLGVL